MKFASGASKYFIGVIFLLISVICFSQNVGINQPNPDPSALLDLTSDSMGLLIPRMTTTDRNNIVSPVEALLIYNTTTQCYEGYNVTTSTWVAFGCIGCTVPTSVTASASPNPICVGSTLTLTGGATNAISWNWTGPNSFTSTLQSPTIASITTAGAGIYTLSACNTCGCTPASTASVTVNSAPAAPIAGTHTPSQTQIIWNWNTVSGATGYKYNTANDYATATDNGASVTYTQTCLRCNTAYTLYVWAYNACGNSTATTLNQTTAACPSITCGTSTVTDVDGNVYNTVLIGTQCWLKENLRTTTYPCGAPITKGPSAHGAAGWTTDSAQYSCPPNVTNNGEDCAVATVATLGLSYQWSAAMDGSITPGAQGVCPTGWHVPTDAEWCTAENTIEAGTDVGCNIVGWRGVTTGSKMATHVTAQNWTINALTGGAGFGNTAGLRLGPSGFRLTNGNYTIRGDYTRLWSSTESGPNAWLRNLHYVITQVNRTTSNKATGFPVRCVED